MTSNNVTDSTFDRDVLGAPGPVLVDFWAEWCGPCRIISPALDEIGEELRDRLTVVKLNVDDSPDTAVRYGVRGIPNLILFKNGEPSARRTGAAPKAVLREWIEASL